MRLIAKLQENITKKRTIDSKINISFIYVFLNSFVEEIDLFILTILTYIS